jgi:glucose/mannose-6-phosphate isomerase
MNNTDDIKIIEKFDKSNMRKLLDEFPHQGEKMIELMKRVNIPSEYKNVKNIIVSGLGGSSVGGDLLRNFLRDKLSLPLMVNRSYTLPHWVDKDSLLICVSYSGNTEETLSAYSIAKQAKSKIIVISAGGELTKLAKKDGFPCVPVPEVGIPPRTALGYLFFPQIVIMKMLGFVDIDEGEISEAIQTLKNLREEIGSASPKDKNIAKKLAEEIYQTVPLVYTTSDYMEGVGVRWKTQINENSKSPVYCGFFSELDHNEIMGWEGGEKLVGQFSLILLRDKGETERMRKRIALTVSLLENSASKILEVHSKGDKLLSRILSLVYIGDYVSFYLAVLNDVDPTEIKSILSLKNSLS